VIPGGAIAAFGNWPGSGNGKGSSLAKTFSVALTARDREPGTCAPGATSNPIDVNLELVDDDGDTILDAFEPEVVCTPGAATYVKFAVEFQLPENCAGSEAPRHTSRGEIHFTVKTVDGWLATTRSILCRGDRSR
jgi:hypothetical protein